MKNYIDFIDKNTTIIPKYDNGKFNFSSSKILPKRIEISNINKIKKKLFKKFKKIKKLLCLDFHGVTDLFDINEKIGSFPKSFNKCIISFIGGSPNTLGNTINSIIPRIQSGEVKLGILVYNKNDNPIEGTKGFIIKIILEILPDLEIYFIDDSKININCVEKLNDNRINLFYIDKHKEPKLQLTNIFKQFLI